ncbi:hypothetical protein D1Z97_09335 [Riemerella anatipestifer]|uniref:hypothetical protein n=1 Tax=Riemerella anatipestifer TaxID=34085 RepID=UPI00129EE949|nr:hypothetical protein [Riemerella anatipestifer]MRM97521.1 hypothetical protein [Riemerella anatipestifer]MRN01370.1 hypothetical protein [Riemerella anatipestifer]MRN03426.1 hypothetical protein [Riemerella anatipestifer]
MEITIKQVEGAKELRAFIYLPEKIHHNHQEWLPPLYIDEEKFFNPKRNPAFQHNDTILLLAYQNGKAVGRIMGIIPHEYNKKQNLKTARFSYFECYEDEAVFSTLLKEVEQWAKSKGCEELIGPMGFSDKEPQGFLTKGFSEPTMMITNSSFEYMSRMILASGYSSFVELCQYDVPLTSKITERYEAFTERIQSRMNITVHQFTSTKQVKPFVKSVFNLINATYQEIYGFTSISEEEMDEFANRFLPLLNPKLIKIISDGSGRVVAFVIAMADLSQGIKKAKGRLLPLGWFHILRASKTSKRLVLLLGGIAPDYQNKGLDAVLATHLFGSAIKLGFRSVDSHLIMRENHKMRAEIERLPNHRMYKEYTIHKKEI